MDGMRARPRGAGSRRVCTGRADAPRPCSWVVVWFDWARRGCEDDEPSSRRVGHAERAAKKVLLLYTYSSGTLVCTTTSAQSRPPKSPEVSAPRGGAWVGAWVSE